MKKARKVIMLSLVLVSSLIFSIIPAQAESQSETDYVNSQGQSIINSIITGNMNTADKVKAINNYLIMNVQYDFSMKSHDSYNAFYY